MVLEIVIGIVLVIAGLISGILLVDRNTPKSHRKITGNDDEPVGTPQKLRELDQGLTDLSDRVTQWMKRSNMRALREQKDISADAVDATQEEKVELTKADLRRRVFSARNLK